MENEGPLQACGHLDTSFTPMNWWCCFTRVSRKLCEVGLLGQGRVMTTLSLIFVFCFQAIGSFGFERRRMVFLATALAKLFE